MERRNGLDDRREENSFKGYIKAYFVKILENLSSAKIWFFILPFIMSSIYMGWIIYEQIDFVRELITSTLENSETLDAINATFQIATNTFISWCTFNVSLAGTIVVVRETFKVSKLKALNDSKDPVAKKQISDISL